MNAWATEYVGLPFASRGRDRRGLDCWGLVRLVYQERLGFSLPSWDGAYLSASDREEVARLIEQGKSTWREIAPGEAREFDVVLLRMVGEACHVALVVWPGWMLHVTEGVNASVERYGAPLWEKRVVGFYRYSP